MRACLMWRACAASRSQACMYAYALVRSAINPQVKNVVQDPRFSSVATVAGSGMEAIGIAALDDGQGAGTFRLARGCILS